MVDHNTMSIFSSQLQSLLPTVEEIQLISNNARFLKFMNSLQQQYEVIELSLARHESKLNNNNDNNMIIIVAGKCAATRPFWYGTLQFIPRARLVTDSSTEKPVGLCFTDITNNNALARLKSAKLIFGIDYITVTKLAPRYGPATIGQTCDSIVTRSGINKLLNHPRYSEHTEFKDFMALLNEILQWIDSNGQTLPTGFSNTWQTITHEEKVQTEIKMCEAEIAMKNELKSERNFAVEALTSLNKRRIDSVIPETPFNSPTKRLKTESTELT